MQIQIIHLIKPGSQSILTDSIYSYSYASGKKLMYDKVIKIKEEDCLNLHKTKTIKLNLSSEISLSVDLEQNEIKTGSAILKGYQDRNTDCKGENFKLNNNLYKNHVLFSDYKILMRRVKAKLDTYYNQIILEGKLTCDSKMTSLFDPETGLYVWKEKDLPRTKCDYFQEILTAEGKLYRPKMNKKEYQAILVIEDKKNSRQAALLLGDNKIICDTIGITTQFEKIFAIVIDGNNPSATVKKISPQSTSRMENLESKIAFTYISSEMRAEDAFSKLTNALCETNRLRIRQALRGFAEQGISMGENHEGSVMIKAGSVAYIFACNPVEADLRTDNLESCTNEIPIKINSTEAFADPVTLVVMRNSTRTFCSSISPVKWAIKSNNSTDWYCSTPQITRCTNPEKLDPMILKTNPYQLKTSPLNLDLYDKEQMEVMDKFLQISNARRSLISDFAYQMTANPGKSTGRIFIDSLGSVDSESLRSILLPNAFRVLCNVWEKMKNWIVTFLVFKYLFNLIMLFVRMKRLISAEGKISWKLLAAINRQIFESCISILNDDKCPCLREESCLCKDEQKLEELLTEKLEKLIKKLIKENEAMSHYNNRINELYGNNFAH